MGYPLRESEFELQPVPIDNARMEKLESVVYELFNIIKHSDQFVVQVDPLNKTRQLDRERNLFLESRPLQDLTPSEIEKLFQMEFEFNDMIHGSLLFEIEEMKQYKALIDRLIEQLE